VLLSLGLSIKMNVLLFLPALLLLSMQRSPTRSLLAPLRVLVVVVAVQA
jgi:hypothetical protein